MDDEFHHLSISSLRSMYLGQALIIVALTLVLLASFQLYGESPYLTIGVLAYAMVLAYLLVRPIIFYKRYRYKIDGDKVEVHKGVLWVSHLIIPLERIHQLDVVRGPINRIFCLADVNITTAGGTASIQYLDDHVAEELVDRLNATVVSILKDRV